MYTKLTGKFDYIEFAESAAKMVRERTDGKKTIVISRRNHRYNSLADSPSALAAAHGLHFFMYPFSTHSNNYLTGMVIKETDDSQINELLCTKSVCMEICCEDKSKELVRQYMLSCGGYDIREYCRTSRHIY